MGFASWDIAPKAYASFPLEADSATDYKIFTDLSVSTFKVGQDGIYVSSYALKTTGSITVSFNVNCTYLYELGYLSDAGSFSFEAKLKSSSADFLYCVNTTASVSIDNGTASTSEGKTESVDDYQYLIHEITINDVVTIDTVSSSATINKESVPIYITYTVTETSRGDIYSSYSNSSFSFLAEALKQ